MFNDAHSYATIYAFGAFTRCIVNHFMKIVRQPATFDGEFVLIMKIKTTVSPGFRQLNIKFWQFFRVKLSSPPPSFTQLLNTTPVALFFNLPVKEWL